MTSHNWSGKTNVEVGENFPATFVSWNDATGFCQRLTDTDHMNGKLPAGESYRLPTDASGSTRAVQERQRLFRRNCSSLFGKR